MKLPIELCEEIVDICAQPLQDVIGMAYGPGERDSQLLRETHSTLWACALTCKAWLPRSLIALYRVVELSGDHKTSNMAQGLIRLSTSLDIKICYLSIISDGPVSRPFYLVSYYLAGSRIKTSRLHTLHLNFSKRRFGPKEPEIFIRSLSTFRSVQRLILNSIQFSTFRYFVYVIYALSSLRDLTVGDCTLNTRQDPLSPLPRFRHRGPKLHSLQFVDFHPAFISRFEDWIVGDGSLVSTLQRLTFDSKRESPARSMLVGLPDTSGSALTRTILDASRKSLRCLKITTNYKFVRPFSLESITSLQTLEFVNVYPSDVSDLLDSLSSQHIHLSRLVFSYDNPSDTIEYLLDTLLSSVITSLPRLSHLIFHGLPEPETPSSPGELPELWNSLRKVYGDRLTLEKEKLDAPWDDFDA